MTTINSGDFVSILGDHFIYHVLTSYDSHHNNSGDMCWLIRIDDENKVFHDVACMVQGSLATMRPNNFNPIEPCCIIDVTWPRTVLSEIVAPRIEKMNKELKACNFIVR